ncbi:MAG: hypothetical protein JOZ98_19830 [Solirubrobacterales bacterium]|nr:hypothetical protein [Solirubrobacterales bacterium]MBV9425168.1 hypothetical protein [Solirubrobacterales bacterium]MBV9800279.1 hypothetical protein [Solirubrobacterales bacterium]
MIEQRSEELAYIDSVDSGSPLSAMRFDIRYSTLNLRLWPSLARWHGGRTIPASPTACITPPTYPPAWWPGSCRSTTR